MERRRVVVKAVTSLSEQLLQSKLRGGSSTPPVTGSSRYARSTVPTNIDEVVSSLTDATYDVSEDEARRLFRKAVSQRTSLANKRIKRLEDANLTDVPAYRNWLDNNDGVKFGLTRDGRRLTDEEAVQEYFRADRFRDMETSTVTGATDFLGRIQERLGLSTTDRAEIQAQSGKVFEVTSKVDQYMKTAGEGFTIGSDELQKIVTEYILEEPGGFGRDTDDLVAMIVSEDLYKSTRAEAREQLRRIATDELGELGDFLL